jgi:two-component system NarL family response regulator
MNICIVEDNEALLENLRLLLDGEQEMTILGHFKDAEEMVRAGVWKKTDILLVDLELPGMQGIDLIRHAHAKNKNTRIIVYTIHEERSMILDAIKAGACGYLLKGARPSQLITALHDIYEGGAPMSPSIARAVLAELQSQEPPDPNAKRGTSLSNREREILRLLDQGLVCKEISDRLAIALSTVHTHIKNMYRKLQAKDKAEAILKGKYKQII